MRGGELSAGHARAPDRPAGRRGARDPYRQEGLTRARGGGAPQEESAKPKRKKASKDADTRAAETELHDALGLNVEIKPGRGEKGELRIRYANFDQFEDMRDRLMRRPER